MSDRNEDGIDEEADHIPTREEMLAAVQHLQQEIDAVEQEIEERKQRIDALEQENEELKQRISSLNETLAENNPEDQL